MSRRSSQNTLGAVLGACLALSNSPAAQGAGPALTFEHSERVLYFSTNLADHQIAAECNPGGGSSCPCSVADVAVTPLGDFGRVTSNARLTNTWVNAIGYKKFQEQLPAGQPITLGTWRYSARVRLPNTPHPSVGERDTPEAVHLMIQLWDGRNHLWPANKQTLEATLFWSLNPWSPNYRKIMVYTSEVTLRETGLTLDPDTAWHNISFMADFAAKSYVSVTADGNTVSVEGIPLAQVSHPDWGNEVALNLTTESLAAWPQSNCAYVFTWSTDFQAATFQAVESQLSWPTAVGTSYQAQSSPDLRSWFDFGSLHPGTGGTVSVPIDLGCQGGFLRVISYPPPSQ